MRASDLPREPGSPGSAVTLPAKPVLGHPDSGPDGMARSLDALATAFAAVQERLERLETDLRNLQSQGANRA